jgi:hypothetical protein
LDPVRIVTDVTRDVARPHEETRPMEPNSSRHMPFSPHRKVTAITLSTIGLLLLATAASGASPELHVGGLLVPTAAADPAVEAEMAAPASSKVSSSALAQPWSMTTRKGAEAIAAGHGTFVAVGHRGDPPQAAAWWSADGRAWEPARLTPASVGSGLTQVSATADGFVALGAKSGRYGAAKERVEAWYSADGRTWERENVKKPAKSGYQAVASGLADGPAGSLALGTFIGQDLAGQRLWRRGGDGTWRPATLPVVNNPVWDAVVSYPRGYLLLGQSGRGVASNWRSVDGLTWKRVKDTPRLFDVAVGKRGTLVGIGYKHIYRSPKGLRAWEKAFTRPTSWRVGGSNAFSFVEWARSAFVVPGNDFSGCLPNTDECHTNPLLVSAGGKAWSQAAGPDGLPGADEATWITDVASLPGATAILGQHEGRTVVWVVDEASLD